MSWLVGEFFGLRRWLWIVIALALVAGGIAILSRAEKADDRANQEIGASQQREGDLQKTLERTEKANEVRETFSANDAAVYAECLRSARTPANCERFLPDRQDSDNQPSAP